MSPHPVVEPLSDEAIYHLTTCRGFIACGDRWSRCGMAVLWPADSPLPVPLCLSCWRRLEALDRGDELTEIGAP